MKTTVKLPRRVKSSSRVLVAGLTNVQALRYLSKLCRRLGSSRRLSAAFVAPFVVAWWADGEGDALGFVLEVWMTKAGRGRWNIVDRSPPLYQLPAGLDRLLS
jgi:hypothetical protein